jgi:hypothetical protein
MLRGRTPRTRFRPRSRPFQEHTLRTGSRRWRCSPWCGTCARVEESAIARAVGFSCPRSYLPTPQDVHGRQDDFPPAGWYVDPTSHCSQLLAPPTLNSPGRQVPHSWMAMFANSPGPQYSQAFLVSETALLTQPYVSSQLVHSIAPGLLYLRAKRVQRKSQAGDRATSRCGTGGSGGLPPSTSPVLLQMDVLGSELRKLLCASATVPLRYRRLGGSPPVNLSCPAAVGRASLRSLLLSVLAR